MAVVLETSVGDITIDLYTEERPRCCLNFLKLCKVKHYNFCLFHSVQRNLVAQTGDPTGTGRGGESIYARLYGEQARYFDAEVSPRMKHKKLGTVSMVNNGSNGHGSQFFITLGEDLDYLDNVHTVFGEVGEGHDILMKINEAYCDNEHRPYKDIRIYHTVIIDDPFDDPPELVVPDRSPEPTKEQLDSGRIGAEEEIDDFKGKTEEEIKEALEDREAKANAQILEMVGDLPSVDVAPEENVLFVCKLNPVTTEEDLEIIFSRFGQINSCEVIKDQKTGDSLQYAFIEFVKKEDCEKAYFRMDNVLIDDRRIHVDFSQSVSKVKWKGKGKGVTYGKGDPDFFGGKYAIKDTSRKDDRYDLVFDDSDVAGSKKKKKKKHKHRGRDESSDSEGSGRKVTKHSKKHKRDRSRSPTENRSRRRSSTPPADRHWEKKKKKHRHSPSPDDDREKRKKYRGSRSPSPDRYRDRRADKKDKYRDRDVYERDRDSRKHRKDR